MSYRYRALKIDLETGDLVTPLAWVYDEDVIRQRITARLHFFRGEWFLDLLEGIPYFRDVLKKNPDRFIISALIKRTILSTPGVRSIDRFSLEPTSPGSRVWRFRFQATADTGRTFDFHADRLRLDQAA
jgi:hypothetical protein